MVYSWGRRSIVSDCSQGLTCHQIAVLYEGTQLVVGRLEDHLVALVGLLQRSRYNVFNNGTFIM